MERKINIADAKAHFSSLIESVAHEGERIILLSRGKPKAALVGVDDLKRLQGGLMAEKTKAVLKSAGDLRRTIAGQKKKRASIEEDLDAIRGHNV